MLRKRIGIVGCGATGLYTLKYLAASAVKLDIVLFESESEAGKGMPYREGTNADYMLCNAFSREIPPLTRSLVEWLETQPARELEEWEMSADDIDARAFYPRVLIGEYLQSEFDAVCELAESAGHRIEVHTDTTVSDLIVEEDHVKAVFSGRSVRRGESMLDMIVIATGHRWPEHPCIDQAQLLSPWPYTKIIEQEPGRIGILGSSLSAIDIVIAIGHAHGTFKEQSERVLWVAHDTARELHVTLVSHNGIMPEGDFHYPFPYEPLRHITPEAVGGEVEQGTDGLLARVFELLLNELDAADPTYLKHLGEQSRSIEGFSSAYFKDREERAGFEAVRENLQEVRASMRRKETIAHRYALLRGHEHFEIALPHLDESDWRRFEKYLLPVFSDCYAALPHLSVARLLAMYDAGVLSIVASGEASTFTSLPSGKIQLDYEEEQILFDVMFDARGQSPAPLSELPFPALVEVLSDATMPIGKPFFLDVSVPTSARIYCLAMPQVLERKPFSQGLPNCCQMSEVVVDDILADESVH